MKGYIALRSFARRTNPTLLSNATTLVLRRSYSTPVQSTDTLPLAGIRVLDMTRVLAGVSWSLALDGPQEGTNANISTNSSHIAHKFWEI